MNKISSMGHGMTGICWIVVLLSMPGMNCWLVHRGPGFEEVFVGSFLAVFWSVSAAILLRGKATMWVVIVLQLLALVVSYHVSSGMIPGAVSTIDRDGYGLMNSIMHGGEAVIVVPTGAIMRLTWWRLD